MIRLGVRVFLVFLSLCLVAGCEQTSEEQPTFVFKPWGIRIRNIPPTTPVKLYNSQGYLILSYPPFWGENETLIFKWRPGEEYRVQLGGKNYFLRAPEAPIKASLKLFVPLGQNPYTAYFYGNGHLRWTDPLHFEGQEFVLVGEGPCFEVGFLFTSYFEGPFSFSVGQREIILGQPFERHLEKKKLCFSVEEPARFEKIGIQEKIFYFRFVWQRVDLSKAVSLVSWQVPTDAYGFVERHRLRDTLVVPNPFWERLARSLGIKAKGFSKFDPFAYETLVLENRLSAPVTLLLQADFLDPRTKKPVAGFYPKRFASHGEVKKPLALVDLPPRKRAKAVLPIFLDQTVSPGEYLARIEVYRFGSLKPLLVREKRIGVVRGNVALSAALLVVLCLGLGYSTYLILGLKSLIARFRLKELSLLALTGAVGFGFDFLGGIASNVLYAFLGPFNVLVGGLVTEVAHYLILTAVLYLVPRPGVVTLSGLITYLMGGFLFGGFRFTDPVFVGVRLLVLEFFLLVLGAYGPSRPRALRLVLALSLADATNTAISLLLHMTFYRLFFPGWFVTLSVGVKGFLYTLIGATFGVRLGKLLLRVER